MARKLKYPELQKLPDSVADFLRLVIKKMRYRKKVRTAVMAELIDHFKDELAQCTTEEEKNIAAQKLIAEFGDPKLLAILLRRAKKRCRPLWRTITVRSLQAAAVLILCFFLYAIWFVSGTPTVTVDYLAQFNELVRPAVDDSQNAEPFYSRAVKTMVKPSPGNKSDVIKLSYADANDTERDLINRWLSTNEQALQFIVEGSVKGHYWRQYNTGSQDKSLSGVLVPDLFEFRTLAYLMSLRASKSAAEGDYNTAFRDLLTSYRFGRHLKSSGTFIEQLVGMVLENLTTRHIRDILYRYEVDKPVLDEFYEQFRQLVENESFIVNIKFEKFTVYDEIQRCFVDDPFGGHLYPQRIVSIGEDSVGTADFTLLGLLFEAESWTQPFHVLFTHPDKKETIVAADRLYDSCQEYFTKTPAALRTENIDISQEAEQYTKDNLLLQIMVPALTRIHRTSYRKLADTKATLAVISFVRYKADKGLFPESLNELVTAGYLEEIPIDPFSDKPLIYKKTDDDFILYSVGTDFVDNGGTWGRSLRGKPYTWADNGDAIFWPVD